MRVPRKTKEENGEILYQCSICKKFHNSSQFPKDRARKYGIRPACKECYKKRYILRIPITTKTCNLCFKEKLLKEFYVKGRSLKYERNHYCYMCIECQTKDRLTNPRKQLNEYRTEAKSKKLEFNLTVEYFTKNSIKNCFYCNSSYSNKIMGLDRINNSIGYNLNNCVPCCKDCNMMKCKRSYEEFIEHCRKIAKNNY